MKNKYKILSFIAILIFVLFPMINIFGQGNENFVESSFVKDLIKIAKNFDKGKFELEIVNLTKPDTDKKFFDASAIYKLQTNIKINDAALLGKNGKHFSALFIDKDGIFDIGGIFFSDEYPNGYTPIIKNTDNNKYQTFYGTQSGKQYIIGILSDEFAYFGNLYGKTSKNPRAKTRYIEHAEKVLKEYKANIFVLEFTVDPNKLGK